MATKRLDQLLAFLEATPNEPFILFAVAKEYEGMNDLNNALVYYEQLTSKVPNYVGTYYHLGKLYQILARENDAFATYKEGMTIAQKQGDQHAFSELAQAKLELGDDDHFE